jgi:hypothetical protein
MDGMLRTGDPKMSADGEDRTLEAEVLAVKTVMAKVLARINRLDPMLADAIRGGLGDASDKIRKMVSKSKRGENSDQAIKALAVVEALRASIIPKLDKPYPAIGRQRHEVQSEKPRRSHG